MIQPWLQNAFIPAPPSTHPGDNYLLQTTNKKNASYPLCVWNVFDLEKVKWVCYATTWKEFLKWFFS